MFLIFLIIQPPVVNIFLFRFCDNPYLFAGSRFRTYYDFGYVALDIIHVTSMDTGEYTVRATNHLGTAHTSAQVRVSLSMLEEVITFLVNFVMKNINKI